MSKNTKLPLLNCKFGELMGPWTRSETVFCKSGFAAIVSFNFKLLNWISNELCSTLSSKLWNDSVFELKYLIDSLNDPLSYKWGSDMFSINDTSNEIRLSTWHTSSTVLTGRSLYLYSGNCSFGNNLKDIIEEIGIEIEQK